MTEDFRVVFDRAPDGLLLVDETGTIVYANAACSDLLAQGSGRLLGAPFGHPLAAGLSTEIDILRADGEVRSGEIRVAAVRTDGRPAWVVAIRDVTRRSRAERELLELAERRDAALSVVAHELRNPLTVVTGLIQALVHRWGEMPDDDRLVLLRRVEAQSLRMDATVRQLLAVAQVDGGTFHASPTNVGLLDLVLERLPDLGERAGEIELDVPADAVVWADPDHVWMIVSNLVGNAVKYGGPPVRISATTHGTAVQIEVTDHGPGVPQGAEATIFGRYDRGTGHNARPGVGLGLWLSSQIAQANGGKLGLRPVDPQGACFWCELPVGPAV